MKTCKRCAIELPLEAFSAHPNTRDKLQPYCKRCVVAAAKASWDRKTPEEKFEAQRRKRLKKRFGITPKQYDAMLEAQGGMCAICRGTCPTGRALAVDHDHKTGALRALLCFPCNSILGQAGDSVDRLRGAAAYLERYASAV